MLHSLRGLNCAVLMICFGLFAQAQSDFTSAGGDGSSEAGFISFSLGQVSYQTVETSSAIISQGVQQSFGIVLKSKEELPSLAKAEVFPNPASNETYLNWKDEIPLNTELYLQDAQGRMLFRKLANTKQTQIPLNELAPGIYFIRLYRDETMTQSIKFIKS